MFGIKCMNQKTLAEFRVFDKYDHEVFEMTNRPTHATTSMLTLYFTCQFWALPIQRQINIRCQKYRPVGIQLSD